MSKKELFFYQSKMKVFSTLREAMEGIGAYQAEVHGLKEVEEILAKEEPKKDDSGGINYDTGTSGYLSVSNGSTFTQITESAEVEEPTHFYIGGEAIHALTTRNLRTYLPEELRKAAPTLSGKTIQLDHSTKSIDTVGKVLASSYDGASQAVSYVGRIRRDHPVAAAVETGDIDTVSIGAYASDVICNICGESKVRGSCRHQVGRDYEGEIATMIGKDLNFVELSVTPVPADPRASAGVLSHSSIELALTALAESFRGNDHTMSEEDNTPVDLSDELAVREAEVLTLQQALQELQLKEKQSLAKRVAEAEIHLGVRKGKDMDQRVEVLVERSIGALELLESSLQERVKLTPEPESRGVITEPANERAPNQLSWEEAKAFLREAVFGLEPPSAEAKRTVARNRRNPEHPMSVHYAELFRGGSD